MRLTHLKLAGFKSFVDPTTLHIHGQRVGIVGPNGCGKSNVMESVRWVLGESSAREMRGDSMQDVIFNGSGSRKAISRGSVELIFDNSLGSAAGEWSQYVEIAVKRVIERDKGSSYYINNTPVRRRDVADLFLGTGLGGRAYAIIGQNTISRIVEAKPEELRVFLEEAAGISKYKERRRETELRLRDTRENLTRVKDICQEMKKQIARLESQAIITEQYHKLQQALKLAQGQLWLLKKRDAAIQWEKSQRQVEKLVNELEAQMAALRKSESLLENLRQQHYTATESVQSAQTGYYEANAEVANLEQQLKHTHEARDRLQSQLQQIAGQSQRTESQLVALQENLLQLEARQIEANDSESQAVLELDRAARLLPKHEQSFATAQERYAEAQRAHLEAEQRIRLETASLDHLLRTLRELEQRELRLNGELASLRLPDEQELAQKEKASQVQLAEIGSLEQRIAAARQQEQQLLQEMTQLRELRLKDERALTQVEAQIASLAKIQQSLDQESRLDDWLKQAGLQDSKRLWQQISINKGWETALEAVFGTRINAIVQGKPGNFAGYRRPSTSLVICQPGDERVNYASQHPLKPLLSVVGCKQVGLDGLLQDWLAHVYLAEQGEDIDKLRSKLQAGELLVNNEGDVYTRHSVSFHAAQSAMHGVLERQRELEALQKSLPQLQSALTKSSQALADTESRLQQSRQDYQSQQQSLKTATQTQHDLNLDIQRLRQQQGHVLQRQQALQTELVTLAERQQSLNTEQHQKQASIDSAKRSVQSLLDQCEQARIARQSAEAALNEARQSMQKSERLVQEKEFNKKIILNNINDINNKLISLHEEKQSLTMRSAEVETMLQASKMEGLKSNLEAALVTKLQRESELASARDAMSSAEQELQAQERMRMQNEHQLHPLRDRLEQARLQEQQNRLHFEQCQAELSATGIEEVVLGENLPANARTSEIEKLIVGISGEIDALGPVNLAAIQELASERERKTYLDSQALDLEQAVATLEEAIHRIDKETRSRLQHAFDEANRHFAELFAVLFGGGQARLELLGEEILDTGMQVFAQPPGKKNSTIHLLSGGEKALTALALVFALFRLNPAPFCLMDEVDAPLDDSNTERFCNMVKKMSEHTQFLFVSHNKITMEMAQQLIGVTMQESGVSRIVDVDIEAAMQMQYENTQTSIVS